VCMVKTQRLSKYYTFGSGNQVVALNDVNLTVASGEFISIMGPSGSGKSTLLNIVGCLDKPTSGDVYIDNMKIDYGNAGSLVQLHRQTMGFVFQGFNLISTMNALENVWYPMYFNKVPKPERIKRAEELLESVGLRDRALHLPSELSGGRAAASVHSPCTCKPSQAYPGR